ncbi:MAG: ATP-binding cassette domain-containing protein [Myxococcales bacterium]|nr:ATP-binding cassette domain-containing protein [Myxococcales bacterium]
MLIEFRDIHKAFGSKKILRGLSMGVGKKEVFFIIGTSGVGKSVTIKHLIGLLRIDEGEIHFDGKRIDNLSEKHFYPIRKRIGMVFQHATLFDSMSLRENVALPLRKHQGMRPNQALGKADELLERVHMQDFIHSAPAALSDGMRKRAAIARTLAMEPQIVLFDEPTTGLDPVNARRIDRLIRELSDELGVTSIVVSHDLTSIFSIADRISFIYQGKAYKSGTRQEFECCDDAIVRQFISGDSHGPLETPGF